MIKKETLVKKVLVTGANGFIGSHLIRKLIEEHYEVGILKRGKSDLRRIEDVLKKLIVFEADLQDTKEVFDAFNDFKPEAVCHLATYYAVDHQPHEVSEIIKTNVLGTINLLEASRAIQTKAFINTSTLFVYKESKQKLKETNDLEPFNLYALSKCSAEEACSFYAQKYGLNIMTFRLFPPYGPEDHKRRLIPYVIQSFLDEKAPKMTLGTQEWDFVYVGDIVNAYMKALSLSPILNGHEIFNIGTGQVVTIRKVVERIKEILDSKLNPLWGAISSRKNEVGFACADISKTKKVLGWEPEVKILENGLNLTITWFKEYLAKAGGKCEQ